MNRIRFVLPILLAFVIAACGTSPPDQQLDEFPWCFTFDFVNETYPLTFVDGQQTANGLESINGSLGVSYTHNQIVEPKYIVSEIEVQIPGQTRNVVTSIDIFGVADNFQARVDTDTINQIEWQPDSAGEFGTTASISLTTESDTLVVVRYLSIYGDGINPFGSNDCGGNNPTVTATFDELPTFTPTATDTPTPTLSPTATATQTATDAPTQEWCYFFDFTIAPYDNFWKPEENNNGDPKATWELGTGWVGDDTYLLDNGFQYQNQITMRGVLQSWAIDPVNAIFVYADLVFSYRQVQGNILSDNNPYARVTIGTIFEERTGFPEQQFDYESMARFSSQSFGSIFDEDQVSFLVWAGRLNNTAPVGGKAEVHSIEFRGLGSNPFGQDNCGANAPSPTPTLDLTQITATASSTPTFTPFPTRTVDATPTIQPTSTPDPNDDTNTFTADGDCDNYSGSEPSGSNDGQWFEWLFGGLGNTFNCRILPTFQFIGAQVSSTASSVGSIFDFLTTSVRDGLSDIISNVKNGIQLFTDTLNWTGGQLVPYLGGWLNNFWAQLSYFIKNLTSSIWSIITGLFGLLWQGVNQVVEFVKSILNFIGTAFRVVGNIFSLWNDVEPEKPPGLPDCLNDPLAYEICAVWYILDNTLFSGVGAFIVPALNVYILLLIAFFFLETVVERMQKIWVVLSD
ncbi:MAG: hypothetical protein AAF846_22230 [Chloroflexota bacterium]